MPIFCIAAKRILPKIKEMPSYLNPLVRVCKKGSHVQACRCSPNIVSEDKVAGCVSTFYLWLRFCCFIFMAASTTFALMQQPASRLFGCLLKRTWSLRSELQPLQASLVRLCWDSGVFSFTIHSGTYKLQEGNRTCLIPSPFSEGTKRDAISILGDEPHAVRMRTLRFQWDWTFCEYNFPLAKFSWNKNVPLWTSKHRILRVQATTPSSEAAWKKTSKTSLWETEQRSL